MEQLVQELQEKLRKSEASRLKLRESLRQLKERAADTTELVRQHQQLQTEVAQKAKEVEDQRLAREQLEQQLEAARHATKHPGRQTNWDNENLGRRLQAGVEKAQQAASDAIATGRKLEHECAGLQKQNVQLRDRIKDVEHKQKASTGDVTHLKGQVGQQAAALQALSNQLTSLSQRQAASATEQAVASSLAERVTQLEALAATSMAACEAACVDRDRLRQRLDAMQAQTSATAEQQQAAMQQLSRWQTAFGALARGISGSPRHMRSNLAPDTARPLPAEDAAAGDGGARVQLVPYCSNDSASSGSDLGARHHAGGAVPGMPGEAVRAQPPASEGARTSTGTVAGPGKGFHWHPGRERPVAAAADGPPEKRQRLVTAGSGGDEGSNAERTPAGIVLTLRQHHERAQTGATDVVIRPSTGAGGPARQRATPEAEGASAASGTAATKAWKSESAAVSVVEGWLEELTSCTEQPVTMTVVQAAAAGLRDALAAGQCPLSCVVAGFETALLECAAPRGFGCAVPENRAELESCSGSAEADRIEDIPFSAVWCRREVLQAGTFTALLSCARSLGRLLEGVRRIQRDGHLVEMLLQRLHAAAVQTPLRLQSALHTESCAVAAACAALYRAGGNLEAMRVLVYDLVVSGAEPSANLLPRLAAALLAWPIVMALTPPSSDDVLGPALLAAVHDFSSSALQEQGREADDTATAAGSVSGTTSATELLPGASAAAAALQAVCERSGVVRVKKGAPGDHERWPASLAALGASLRRSAAMVKAGETQPDQWHCVVRAMQVATACLGADRCREQAKAIGAFGTVAGAIEPSEKGKLGWLSAPEG